MTIPEITVDELADLLVSGVRLIDVREPNEYDEARVPGGQLIPLATIPDNLDAFRGDGPTYVVCRSGGRSRMACEYLAAQGAEAINVAGGVLAWIASGHEIATGAA